MDEQLSREKSHEEAKRLRHSRIADQLSWGDDLLRLLPESPAYHRACTPAARLEEQHRLLKLFENYDARPK